MTPRDKELPEPPGMFMAANKKDVLVKDVSEPVQPVLFPDRPVCPGHIRGTGDHLFPHSTIEDIRYRRVQPYPCLLPEIGEAGYPQSSELFAVRIAIPVFYPHGPGRLLRRVSGGPVDFTQGFLAEFLRQDPDPQFTACRYEK